MCPQCSYLIFFTKGLLSQKHVNVNQMISFFLNDLYLLLISCTFINCHEKNYLGGSERSSNVLLMGT